MKRILFFAMALLLAAAFFGCTKGPEDLRDPDKTRLPLSELDFTPHAISYDDLELPGATGAADGIDVIWRADFTEQIKVRSGGSTPGAYYEVITDYETLNRLVGSTDGLETRLDGDTFISDFVVAVFVTVRSGGFTFSVDSAYNDGNTVKIKVTAEPPAAGAMVTQAFETHCMLIGFDRADFYDDLVYEITVNGDPAGQGPAES